MKKAILSVSYGSSDESQIENTIDRVENEYRRVFPETEIRRAFTSRRVIEALRSAGTPVDTVPEALDRLCRDGFDHVYIQPTHIISGGEYDSIRDCAAAREDRFRVIRVGGPLLDGESDNEFVCRFFASRYGSAGQAIVLVGHGSDHTDNKKYGELQETAKRLGFDEIFVMTLEASPSLDDILPEIRAAGFGKVRLIPLLFGAAGHAKRDIAGDRPESVASRFRAERFEVESVVRGLGEYQEFAALYAAHLRRAAK